MAITDISKEPLQNQVATNLGTKKAWRIVATDPNGNALVIDSIGWEKRFDYDTRTDGQPVYIGYTSPGTATSTANWLIQKFTYNGSDFVTRIEVATSVAWTARTTSF